MTSPTLSSVTNALRILKEFSAGETSLGVSDLARRLGIAKSTTHRLLTTLAAEGFVRHLPGGQYGLGLTLWELGSLMVHGFDLREVAHPILEQLRNQTGETVHLAILDGTDVVYIDRFEAPATLQLFRRLGHRMPAHATSSGKALLAYAAPEVVEHATQLGLRRLAPGTITKKQDLLERLEQIRQQGWVVSVEESEPGVASAGAPVFDRHGVAAGAISVAGPLARMPTHSLDRTARRVRQAADQISLGLGHTPSLLGTRTA